MGRVESVDDLVVRRTLSDGVGRACLSLRGALKARIKHEKDET